MSWNDPNVYFDPEKFGLKIIESYGGSVSYQFNMVILWEDIKTRERYWAADSSCSCPAPFERFTGIGDLIPLIGSEESYKVAVRKVKASMED